MSRLPPVDKERLSAKQQEIYGQIINVRGQVRGPFAIWLNSPELCQLALQTQDWFQKHSQLPPRLVELAILIMARKANAQFAWAVHEKRAADNGLSTEVIGAIRRRVTPEFQYEDERLVYDLVNELAETHTLLETSFVNAEKILGAATLVELVSLTGFYMMVALVLNAFDADPPPGQKRLET